MQKISYKYIAPLLFVIGGAISVIIAPLIATEPTNSSEKAQKQSAAEEVSQPEDEENYISLDDGAPATPTSEAFSPDDLEMSLPLPGTGVDDSITLPLFSDKKEQPRPAGENVRKPLEKLAPYQVLADISTAPSRYREVAARLKEVVETTAFNGNIIGIEVQAVDTGEEIIAFNSELPMNPASNVKLITSAAALSLLGPAYRYKTEIYTDAPISDGGVIKGNFYIKGHGDPSIVSERLWLMVNELRARGLTKIDGNIILDETYFSGSERNPAWTKESKGCQSYQAPYSAISLNFNAVAVSIMPNESVGKPPRVILEPDTPYLKLENKAVTAQARRTRISVSTEDLGQKTRVLVRGQMTPNAEGRLYYRMVYHPSLFFAETLKSYLEKQGIKVTGKIKKGTVPDNAEKFYTYKSPPLSEILYAVNKKSNNVVAEHILKNIGAEVYGAPGDWDKGLKALAEFFSLAGVYSDEYILLNGSGLSEGSRVSPRAFVKLLTYMHQQKNILPEYLSSLSIASTDGTLSGRMLLVSMGSLRAKTGSLDNSAALSGFVISSLGETLTFSAIINSDHLNYQKAVGALDKIGEILASPLKPLPEKVSSHQTSDQELIIEQGE